MSCAMDNVEHTCTPIEELVPDYFEHVNRDSWADLSVRNLNADLRCPRCLFAFNALGLTDVQAFQAVIDRLDLQALSKQVSDAIATAHARTIYADDEIPF